MPQLICQDLTLGYEGKALISGLSFAVNTGEYLCVAGENGAGKSTLMKAILKLKAPISGKIEKGDGLAPNEIGYLPQQTSVQRGFPASVKEVILSGFLNRCGTRPFYRHEEKQKAADIMGKLGITGLAKRCYRELSGGQQQRVLLARALCSTRKILLLDEPAAGLDPVASQELYEIIKELNDSGTTIIMISHDIAASVKYASHVLHIGNQGILFYGKARDYVKSDIGRLYIGNSAETGGEQA